MSFPRRLLTVSDIDRRAEVTQPAYWWNGEGDLVFEGKTWRGPGGPYGNFVGTNDIEQETNLPDERAAVEILLDSDTAWALWSQDLGPVRVELGFIYLKAGVWTRIPRRIKGRLSELGIDPARNMVDFEIESPHGSIIRGTPKWWSHATQSAEFPGDNAFEQAAVNAASNDRRWPPSRN